MMPASGVGGLSRLSMRRAAVTGSIVLLIGLAAAMVAAVWPRSYEAKAILRVGEVIVRHEFGIDVRPLESSTTLTQLASKLSFQIESFEETSPIRPRLLEEKVRIAAQELRGGGMIEIKAVAPTAIEARDICRQFGARLVDRHETLARQLRKVMNPPGTAQPSGDQPRHEIENGSASFSIPAPDAAPGEPSVVQTVLEVPARLPIGPANPAAWLIGLLAGACAAAMAIFLHFNGLTGSHEPKLANAFIPGR